MIPRSYYTKAEAQSKAAEMATAVLGATSPLQIVAVCAEVESFLQKHTPDQSRCFFSLTFPTLISKIFGFDCAAKLSQSPIAWIDIAALSDDPQLPGMLLNICPVILHMHMPTFECVVYSLRRRIFSLLSPNGVLLSSIAAVDDLSLVKYVFPIERLPVWVQHMLQTENSRILSDLCPLFRGRLKEDSIKGPASQVHLNVFEYYTFWFAYYPVCRRCSETPPAVRVKRSREFRFKNWAYSIPNLSNNKPGTEWKKDGNLYAHLLFAYLHAYVYMHDLNAHQPYCSSLLHYSSVYNTFVAERAEFFVNTLIHFWLVDNDFSPLPVNLCKMYGVLKLFHPVLNETPPNSRLCEVVNVLVKYLNLNSFTLAGGNNNFSYIESPRWNSGSADTVKSRDDALSMHSFNYWHPWVQRPLYRFILRTFMFSPVCSHVKTASQVFTVWVNYLEPWTISLEEFAELDAGLDLTSKDMQKEVTNSLTRGYSSAWQGFVLANYLFYSSLVMHFIEFSHRFLHTDPEIIVQMMLKVIVILTSSVELTDLIKNVDSVFHSKSSGSSNSMLNLDQFTPAIHEQLQDWEDGLCKSEVDGSSLPEIGNKGLKLFSYSEDGGQKLLQLFVLRAESELQAMGGDKLAQNFECLDTLKSQLVHLFGAPIMKKPISMSETTYCDEIFKPRSFGHRAVVDFKCKDDWMKRPICNDEIAWLAKLLMKFSGWINESLGLNQDMDISSHKGSPSWSYIELSSKSMCGTTETMKAVLWFFLSWLICLSGAGVELMRKHGLQVNFRVLALKKVVMMLLIISAYFVLKKVFTASQTGLRNLTA
nr:Sphingomyelin phosphodiesterase like [Ipomoea batatas]